MVHWQHREVVTVAHVKHFAMGDARRLTHELERDRQADGSWAFKPTGEIDQSRTHQNYRLGGSGRAADRVAARLADPALQVAKRKDLNVLSDWVITCPEALQEDPAKRDRFFQLAYEFTQSRYGPENVMPAAVHLDETSPHMHVPVVPVKDGRVSAKALFTRRELADFHTELDRACEFEFGMRGLIRNGRTKGDYTVAELKQRTKDQKAIEAAQRAAEALLASAKAEAVRTRQRTAEAHQRAKELQEQAEAAIAAGDAYQKTARTLRSDDQALIDYMKRCKYDTGATVYDSMRQRMVANQQKQTAKQPVKRPAASRAEAMRELDRLTAGLQQQADGRTLDF